MVAIRKAGRPNTRITVTVDNSEPKPLRPLVKRRTRSCSGKKTTARIIAKAKGRRKFQVMKMDSASATTRRTDRKMMVLRLPFMAQL